MGDTRQYAFKLDIPYMKKILKLGLTSNTEEDMECNSHKFLETCDSFNEK